jgi:hypothetical protein
MGEAKDRFLAELEAAVRGPRAARKCLLEEIKDHLRDAASANAGEAEEDVIARLGSAREIAAHWNEHQLKRRGKARRRIALVSTGLACAVALGLTQYAAGGRTPEPIKRCGGGMTGRTSTKCDDPAASQRRSRRPTRAPAQSSNPVAPTVYNPVLR